MMLVTMMRMITAAAAATTTKIPHTNLHSFYHAGVLEKLAISAVLSLEATRSVSRSQLLSRGIIAQRKKFQKKKSGNLRENYSDLIIFNYQNG